MIPPLLGRFVRVIVGGLIPGMMGLRVVMGMVMGAAAVAVGVGVDDYFAAGIAAAAILSTYLPGSPALGAILGSRVEFFQIHG
jgi:hypothetical protein